jgi:hypothetical protein
MRLGLLYAMGHAAMVAALGSAVIVFQLSLPQGIDRIAERLVGLTLLILGVYVLGSLFKGNPAYRSRFHVMAGATTLDPLEDEKLLARSRCLASGGGTGITVRNSS